MFEELQRLTQQGRDLKKVDTLKGIYLTNQEILKTLKEIKELLKKEE